jgi:hypothetical protein
MDEKFKSALANTLLNIGDGKGLASDDRKNPLVQGLT